MALRGIRALGIALGLGVAGADNVYDRLTNKACRQMMGDPQCSGLACLTKFDVITSITSVDDCKMVCDALEKTCTGYEYGTATNRCEIWKVMIMGSTDLSNFDCYNRTDDGSTETDDDLYVWITATITGMNHSLVVGLPLPVKQAAAGAIKNALARVYGGANVNVSADDVKVNFTENGIDVGLINTQADKTLPLRMYRLLGSNNPNDGLSSIIPGLGVILTQNFSDPLNASGVLLPDATDLAVTLSARSLRKDMPTDMFPSRDMMMPTTTTAPSQNQVSAAPAPGPKAVSVCFVFLFAGLGLAWLMP